MAIPRVMPKNVQESSTAFVKCNTNKPNHPVNGPGNTGKKEPIRPNIVRKKPSITNNISMFFCLSDENTKSLLQNYSKGRVVVFDEPAIFTAQLAVRNQSKIDINAYEAIENYMLLLNIVRLFNMLY